MPAVSDNLTKRNAHHHLNRLQSTDGHVNEWSCNLRRLNLHVLQVRMVHYLLFFLFCEQRKRVDTPFPALVLCARHVGGVPYDLLTSQVVLDRGGILIADATRRGR